MRGAAQSFSRPTRVARAVRRRAFRYGRTFFLLRALLLALVVAVLLFAASQLGTPPPWFVVLAALLSAHLVVVGVSPLLTDHSLTGTHIVLRQGWYFRVAVSLEDVDAVGPWDGEPKFGLRLSRARGTLYVVGSRENLISVRLRAPRRFPHVLFLRAREVVFDVDDRDAFLSAVEER